MSYDGKSRRWEEPLAPLQRASNSTKRSHVNHQAGELVMRCIEACDDDHADYAGYASNSQ